MKENAVPDNFFRAFLEKKLVTPVFFNQKQNVPLGQIFKIVQILFEVSELKNKNKRLFLNKVQVELIGKTEQVQNPTNEMKLEATITALDDIAKLIPQGYVEYKGTKRFNPLGISKVFGKEENTPKIINGFLSNDLKNHIKFIFQDCNVNFLIGF